MPVLQQDDRQKAGYSAHNGGAAPGTTLPGQAGKGHAGAGGKGMDISLSVWALPHVVSRRVIDAYPNLCLVRAHCHCAAKLPGFFPDHLRIVAAHRT